MDENNSSSKPEDEGAGSKDVDIDEDHLSGEETDFLNITCLPEVALVNIMEFLNLKERYCLSQTCHLFYELFSHPKLWQSARIHLMPVGAAGKNRFRWRLQSVMHNTMAEIVTRFSHLFQHLSLEMTEYVQCFDIFCLQLLRDLNKDCRLSSLSLKLGPITSNDRMRNRAASIYSNTQDLPHVTELIRNAVRLKVLKIISWPLFASDDDQPDDLFQAMMDNKKLSSLESLSFFYLDKRDGQWTERTPKLPSPVMTFKIVSCFNNLSHLALRSPMISSDLLIELASKKYQALRLIEILIMFSRDAPYSEGIRIPNIEPDAWAMLASSKPMLSVEFAVLARIPLEQLMLMLKPQVPLTSLSIQTYSQCNSALIQTVAERYSKSLRKFESLCHSSDCDSALILLSKSCLHLEHLSYHGDVSYLTVMKIADILKEKGTQISCFQFTEKCIKTDVQTDEEDEDIVVARDADSQELYLVGVHRWHRESAAHQPGKLDEMSRKVSEVVGYNWRPL